LRVALVDPERNLLAIRGAVPGARGALVLVREAIKATKS
jgi:large subunit ribosomal protein L3